MGESVLESTVALSKANNTNSTLLRHEFWLYIFDALLMFLVMVVMNVGHPGVIRAQLMKSAVDVETRETSKGGTELSNRMVPSRQS